MNLLFSHEYTVTSASTAAWAGGDRGIDSHDAKTLPLASC